MGYTTTRPVRPYKNEGEIMKYEEARKIISDVRLIANDGEVVAAGTRDQMHSFVKHYLEDGDYLIIEGDEVLKLSRSESIG